VADLVLPIKDLGMSGMGGLGGGMGGMMSGMGGGMGMGGMGMGGGMGGMGMGGFGGGMGRGGMGGGMGMFNIPQRLPQQIPPGGFQAFAVKDDLRVSPKSVAPKATTAPKTATKTETSPKTGKIQIEISEGADPNIVWDKYFTDNVPEPAAVRDAARRLMDKKQYAHLIAFVKAALRHGDAQPWMYEALVIAMQADNRPPEEIERAALSAVDFAQNPLDLMYIGIYLTRLGLDEPALKIFRQVAVMAPTRHEPYVYGLHAAKRLNNLEGLQWASLGIVSQAWPKEQSDVWKSGLYAAKDIMEKLRAEKRTKEAEDFEKRFYEAIHRDCVIVVQWTGEADIDIMVEEPSGSVCSLRNPRSTGGGILLGDGGSLFGAKEDGHREVYVCPRGFDGTYRLMVQRVWGRVTTGKITVEVFTHYNSANGKKLRKSISLEDDKALVAFDLKDGRRKEPLAEAQLANAAAGQMAVGRQILAQQLAAEMDPRVMQSLAASRAFVNGNGGANGFVPVPWAANGAVGYQPIIITLPEGANLMATAVVSADRRYVRITCVPLFSGVSEVHIFNMATGSNTTGQGGTGGQGFGDLFGNNGGNQQQPAVN
jgi:tetratricopeptide (TPR) repeat protein